MRSLIPFWYATRQYENTITVFTLIPRCACSVSVPTKRSDGRSSRVSSIVAYWYRATCFGTPCGPWRTTMRQVRADLQSQGLGSYDEFGVFFITVPGGIDRESDWMDFDVWQGSHLPVANRASGTLARSLGRRSYRARHHSGRSCRGQDC